jgi:hypothetical protein
MGWEEATIDNDLETSVGPEVINEVIGTRGAAAVGK